MDDKSKTIDELFQCVSKRQLEPKSLTPDMRNKLILYGTSQKYSRKELADILMVCEKTISRARSQNWYDENWIFDEYFPGKMLKTFLQTGQKCGMKLNKILSADENTIIARAKDIRTLWDIQKDVINLAERQRIFNDIGLAHLMDGDEEYQATAHQVPDAVAFDLALLSDADREDVKQRLIAALADKQASEEYRSYALGYFDIVEKLDRVTVDKFSWLESEIPDKYGIDFPSKSHALMNELVRSRYINEEGILQERFLVAYDQEHFYLDERLSSIKKWVYTIMKEVQKIAEKKSRDTTEKPQDTTNKEVAENS